MHDEAMAYVEQRRTDEALAVLDVGGRWINGGVRELFPNADPYVSLDIVDGPASTSSRTRRPGRRTGSTTWSSAPRCSSTPRSGRRSSARSRPRSALGAADPHHGGPASAAARGQRRARWDPHEFYENVDPDELEHRAARGRLARRRGRLPLPARRHPRDCDEGVAMSVLTVPQAKEHLNLKRAAATTSCRPSSTPPRLPSRTGSARWSQPRSRARSAAAEPRSCCR
jgi:hypothetical protein